jgi:outer membrane protein OmpA-like peptidoglycan-associated protein
MRKAKQWHANSAFRRVVRFGVIFAVLTGGPVACSSVPDWADPVEWYKDTKDWVVGDDDIQRVERAKPSQPIPGARKSFPELSSVPQRPVGPSAAEQKSMARGLIADREAARYSNQNLRRQDSGISGAVGSAPPPRIVSSVPTASAPSPQPVASAPFVPPTLTQAPPAPKSTTAAALIAAAQPLAMPSTVNRSLPQLAPSGRPAFGTRVLPSIQTGGVMVQANRFAPRFPSGTGVIAATPTLSASNTLATVYFKSGSSRLSSRTRSAVRKAANQFKQRGGRLLVVGHASSRTQNLDPVSHQMANFKISYDRAQAVARELVRRGVSALAITVKAASDSQRVFLEVMPAGETGNRRVEIILTN